MKWELKEKKWRDMRTARVTQQPIIMLKTLMGWSSSVNCPSTRWSLYLSFGSLYWSSSLSIIRTERRVQQALISLRFVAFCLYVLCSSTWPKSEAQCLQIIPPGSCRERLASWRGAEGDGGEWTQKRSSLKKVPRWDFWVIVMIKTLKNWGSEFHLAKRLFRYLLRIERLCLGLSETQYLTSIFTATRWKL